MKVMAVHRAHGQVMELAEALGDDAQVFFDRDLANVLWWVYPEAEVCGPGYDESDRCTDGGATCGRHRLRLYEHLNTYPMLTDGFGTSAFWLAHERRWVAWLAKTAMPPEACWREREP